MDLTTILTTIWVVHRNTPKCEILIFRKTATERPMLTLDQLYALVDLMPDRWKAFLLLKTFAALRWGQITALTRNDLDLERRTVRIRRQLLTMPRGLQLGPPKSRVGIRMVSFRLPSCPNYSTTWTPTLSTAQTAGRLSTSTGSRGTLLYQPAAGWPTRRSRQPSTPGSQSADRGRPQMSCGPWRARPSRS
jgi:hypothetical protein